MPQEKTKSLKIDDVSRQSGLTKRTIRFYEDLGLIPKPERSAGGTRRYRQEHVDVLRKISQMKVALGFTLEEMQRFMHLNDALYDYREDYKNLSDRKKKQDRLKEIVGVIDEQLQLVESKLEKIHKVKLELVAMRKRATIGMQKLKKSEGKI
ncbi:MAG: MerR family transcriptional regulator [Spirochaetes bacterium]|nr:MerR family transcriptional regulator [Spirochaetota bacterium]